MKALSTANIIEDTDFFASPLELPGFDACDPTDPDGEDVRTPSFCSRLQRKLFSPLDAVEDEGSDVQTDSSVLDGEGDHPSLVRPQRMEAIFENYACDVHLGAEAVLKKSTADEEKEEGSEGGHASEVSGCYSVGLDTDIGEYREVADVDIDVEQLGAHCSECGMDDEDCSSEVSSVDYQKFDSISDVRAALESHVVCWPAPTALDLEDHLSRAPDVRIFWFLDVRDRMYNAAMAEDWEQSAVALEPIQEYPPGWPQWRIHSVELRQACRASRVAAAAAVTKRRSRGAHDLVC